jgi:hypothetical protein
MSDWLGKVDIDPVQQCAIAVTGIAVGVARESIRVPSETIRLWAKTSRLFGLTDESHCGLKDG